MKIATLVPGKARAIFITPDAILDAWHEAHATVRRRCRTDLRTFGAWHGHSRGARSCSAAGWARCISEHSYLL